MNDDLPNGLIFKLPHDNAPDFVKGKLSIKNADFIVWLQAREGEWTNLDLKISKQDKPYAAVDNWKPDREAASPAPASKPRLDDVPSDDDIPF